MSRGPMSESQAIRTKYSSTWLSWLIALTVGLWLIFMLAFQFARITQFPIGDDPAIHVTNIKTMSYRDLSKLNYPLPIAIYKYVYNITAADPAKLFTQIISSYLFIAAVTLGIVGIRAGNNVATGLAAAILFVTGRWVNDYLRMGTLAEVFGWSMLLLTLYTLASNRLILTYLLTIVLAVSHPFSLLVYVIVATIYLTLSLFSQDKMERSFAIKLLTAYAVSGIILAVLAGSRLHSALSFSSGDPMGWGERSFWEIVSEDDIKRVFIPVLAVFGFISLAPRWNQPVIKILYIFLAVSLFLSVNQVLGIHFLAFRFYAYLEMAIGLFAAIGITSIVQGLRIRDEGALLIIVGLALLFALPSYFVNQRYLMWQKNDPNAHATMSESDLTAIDWIQNHTAQDAAIAADGQHSLWITALTDRQRVAAREWPYDTDKFHEYMDTYKKIEVDYIYYPSTEEVPEVIKPYLLEVYDHGGVRIYRINHEKT